MVDSTYNGRNPQQWFKDAKEMLDRAPIPEPYNGDVWMSQTQYDAFKKAGLPENKLNRIRIFKPWSELLT